MKDFQQLEVHAHIAFRIVRLRATVLSCLDADHALVPANAVQGSTSISLRRMPTINPSGVSVASPNGLLQPGRRSDYSGSESMKSGCTTLIHPKVEKVEIRQSKRCYDCVTLTS